MADSSEKLAQKVKRWLRIDKLPVGARKPVVLVVGSVLLAAGVVMIVFPGPAFVFIPLGLLVLATEFAWAQRLADKAQNLFERGREKWRARKARRAGAH